MPPKGKTVAKPKEAEKPTAASTVTTSAATPAPATVNERTKQRIEAIYPLSATVSLAGGISRLSPAERTLFINARFAQDPTLRAKLGTKAQRDLWRHVNEASLPVRTLPPLKPRANIWGVDKTGRDVGTYSPEEFAARSERRNRLTCLLVASRAFGARRERARRGARDSLTGEVVIVADNEVDQERERRKEMDALKRELYGVKTGSYAQDPEWDGVVPVELGEQEGELAAIAYPEDYAEAISYLRASMLRKEYSPRTLRLTEHIIKLNPAHYTVWLYRFSILSALNLPIPEEIKWLNGIALSNLKNYQIWHHRHLLVDHYYPTIASDPTALAAFAVSETDFLSEILERDTKNYHVWSYRSFLVRKLGMWKMDNERERRNVEAMIEDDVRNNSAWSHRFFVVFNDPEQSTPDIAATQPDPAVPDDIISREIQYAQTKIYLAPQNQSPWNYLRGVLVKGGRRLAEVEDFVKEFAKDIGEDEKEEVRSSHALDLLAEIYAEKGDRGNAAICLKRLGEKWDPIRYGYWEWRRGVLEA